MKNNVIIFGDSYSTFEGYVPDGRELYYHENDGRMTDVTKVDETWWYQVVREADLNLILNDSWSGSTICYTRYNNEDCSKTSSFIYRLRCLIRNGFFEKNEINTVFVFGGTNDNWADVTLGTLKYDDLEEKDLYNVLPAISHFFKTLKETLPDADIYCLINTELKDDITEGFEKVCKKYDITAVSFDSIDKAGGHPTVKGMKDIKTGVLKNLIK